MLNHTYTSVKNANLVDCGKKQHIASQPSPLLKDNFLGEFRTELDKKKVLANLGVATDLSLEWEYIKGDIGRSEALMQELDSRTKYTTQVGEFKDKVISIIEGIQYLETIVGGEQEGEDEQNERLKQLEDKFKELADDLDLINQQLKDPIKTDIDTLKQNLEEISKQIANINDLIQISGKAHNALVLIPENSEQLAENETPGLYVPDLEPRVEASEKRFEPIETNVQNLQTEVETVKKEYVSKAELGGDGDFKFVKEQDFTSYVNSTSTTLGNIQKELNDTVKTGSDGHVNTLYVNKVSKDTDGNIQLTDSFEMTEGVPLDVRFVVPSRLDLAKLDVKVCYAGMGVIVKDESALYILREPEGGKLTKEFIENVDVSWKCPEDLVTQALTREEFDALLEVDPETGRNKINPTKFYYIYEEDIAEPRESEFPNKEAYQEAYEAWLKIIHQEYMSAAWGVDIEKKVAKKADQVAVDKLDKNITSIQKEIEALSGGEGVTSLASLSERIDATEQDLAYLLGTEGTETEASTEGKIVEIETSIQTLDKKIEQTYVSIESITDPNNQTNYIFVKKVDYDEDRRLDAESLATSITTQNATINSLTSSSIDVQTLETDSIILQDSSISLSDNNNLLFNNKQIALSESVPVIEYLTQSDYDNRAKNNELVENVYYYTTNEEFYVTESSFTKKTNDIDTSIRALNSAVTALQSQVATLNQQISDLDKVIKDLSSKTPETENPEENLE